MRVARAERRPAAILFADLEGSSSLARRLSTASYFALGRRLARAADHCVIDAGGLVGRHVGDGVVAFFLAETAGSDSAAARSCIDAARALREAVREVAARSELQPEDVVLRFGLHWGSNLYVGNISTAGRSEVTALGDEVNEAARIEACASGGRALASKDLIERLDPEDAAALDLDPDRVTYTALGELDDRDREGPPRRSHHPRLRGVGGALVRVQPGGLGNRRRPGTLAQTAVQKYAWSLERLDCLQFITAQAGLADMNHAMAVGAEGEARSASVVLWTGRHQG